MVLATRRPLATAARRLRYVTGLIIVASSVLALGFAAPAAAHATTPEASTPGAGRAPLLLGTGRALHWNADHTEVVGFVYFSVYSNRSKHIRVCDFSPLDEALALQVDPTGGGPPDTLVYRDENESAAGCLEHWIGYSVRKWRWVWQVDGRVTDAGAWQVWPLPHHDF